MDASTNIETGCVNPPEKTRAAGVFRQEIAGLRAIAVTLVILFHYHIGPFRGGFIGVDVFFVISGFLMTKIVSEGVATSRFSLARFYQARARRIVPALAVMTATVLAFGWVFVDPLTYAQLAAQGATSLVFISNIYYFMTAGYFSPSAEAIWFLHTWSLSVEWQFYLIFPIVWAILYRRLPKHALMIMATFTALAFVADSCLGFLSAARINSFLFYMFPSRAPEMTAGGLAYLLQRKGPDGGNADHLRWLGLETAGIAMILLSSLISRAEMPWPGPFTLLPTAGTMLVILANRGSSSLLANSVFAALGRWSYSIYLWHWPLMVAFIYFRGGIGTFAPLLVLLSILLGMLSYRFVEERTARRGRFPWIKVPFSAVAIFGVTLAAAATIAYGDGVPWRSDPATRSIIAKAKAASREWDFPSRCNGRLCTLGSGVPARTLVVGDSHAEMWYPALRTHAETTGRAIDLLATAGCAPVPQIVKLGNRACERSSSQIGKLIASRKYNRVILIAAWFDYLQPAKPASNCVKSGVTCALIDNDTAAAAARGQLVRFAEQAERTGARVIVVAPTPVAPFDVPQWIAAHAFRKGPDAIAVLRAYPTLQMFGDKNGVASTFDQLRRHGILVPNPGAGLCAASGCHLIDGAGNSLYKDNNHLRSFVIKSLPVDWVDQ